MTEVEKAQVRLDRALLVERSWLRQHEHAVERVEEARGRLAAAKAAEAASAEAEIKRLRARQATLEVDNRDWRTRAEAAEDQVAAVRQVVNDMWNTSPRDDYFIERLRAALSSPEVRS